MKEIEKKYNFCLLIFLNMYFSNTTSEKNTIFVMNILILEPFDLFHY